MQQWNVRWRLTWSSEVGGSLFPCSQVLVLAPMLPPPAPLVFPAIGGAHVHRPQRLSG
jgi:hypothetical protein